MPDTKVTADTLFYAGSTTKAQTAACLSALIQNGSHEALAGQWSTTLASILKDDFVLRDQWATDHMTLEDAVSHRTGLPRHDRSLMRERDGVPLSLRDNVRNLRNLPYVNEPRTKFVYSNYMYMALSHVIETVTKKELKQVMRELIWDPLGMKSTYFGFEDASKAPEPLATGYIWINETQQHAKTAYMPVTDLSGAAAVISNVRDYARWIQGLLNETQLFDESVHQDILTSRMIGYGLPNGNLDVNLYGLGWFRSTFRGKVVYRHDGSMIGFKAQVYWFPDDKFGFVIFSNSDDSRTAINDISWKLIADKFGIPETELLNTTKRFVPPRQPWQRRQANTRAISSRSGIQTPQEVFDEAVANLFPDRPKDPAPPSFSMSDMEGAYADAGYGTMTLRADASKEKTLLAERPDMTWHYGLSFRHISGDSWVAAESWLEDMARPGQFHPVEFVKGDDGKPSALKMKWLDSGLFEGNVTFTKIKA